MKELLEGFKEEWAPVMENLEIADEVGAWVGERDVGCGRACFIERTDGHMLVQPCAGGLCSADASMQRATACSPPCWHTTTNSCRSHSCRRLKTSTACWTTAPRPLTPAVACGTRRVRRGGSWQGLWGREGWTGRRAQLPKCNPERGGRAGSLHIWDCRWPVHALAQPPPACAQATCWVTRPCLPTLPPL